MQIRTVRYSGGVIADTGRVASAVALQQPVGFHFAQVVAQLSRRVSGGREAEAGNNGLVDFGGAPSQDLGAGVQQHLLHGAARGCRGF